MLLITVLNTLSLLKLLGMAIEVDRSRNIRSCINQQDISLLFMHDDWRTLVIFSVKKQEN